MIDEQAVIDSICSKFDEVSVYNLESIEDVVNIVRQYQDIIEEHDLETSHHIIEAIEEPIGDETVSLMTSLVEADGTDTDLAFVVHYTKSGDTYEVFADVDYQLNAENELDLTGDSDLEEDFED